MNYLGPVTWGEDKASSRMAYIGIGYLGIYRNYLGFVTLGGGQGQYANGIYRNYLGIYRNYLGSVTWGARNPSNPMGFIRIFWGSAGITWDPSLGDREPQYSNWIYKNYLGIYRN